MKLNKKNEIDKKISKIFPKDVIENAKADTIEYFGMNFSSNVNEDISFKIYYRSNFCKKQYSEYNEDSLINYLIEKDMLRYLQVVYDENNKEFSRCEIGIQNQSDENMEELIKYFDKNIKFFYKYKDEILKISKMKRDFNEKYSSLHFVGFEKENNEIKVLKCHWCNKIRRGHKVFNDRYYLNFLQKKKIYAFSNIIPYAKSAIKNCKCKLFMEGIDYNENAPEKYKIYLLCSYFPPYDGLIETFQDNDELTKKINIIREWNSLHPEFYCQGFAIGKDQIDNLTLNLYFSYK